MTKIDALENTAKLLLENESSAISGEEYLALIERASTQAEVEFYAQLYNYFLAKRQKEVIANEHY